MSVIPSEQRAGIGSGKGSGGRGGGGGWIGGGGHAILRQNALTVAASAAPGKT